MTFNEAEEEREKIFKAINELKKDSIQKQVVDQKKIIKKMESLKKNLEYVRKFRNKIIDTIRKEVGYSSKSYGQIFKDKINLDWVFKKISEKDLKSLLTNIQDAKESVKILMIPDSLIRFISKILLGNIINKEDAYYEFVNVLNRTDVKISIIMKKMMTIQKILEILLII